MLFPQMMSGQENGDTVVFHQIGLAVAVNIKRCSYTLKQHAGIL